MNKQKKETAFAISYYKLLKLSTGYFTIIFWIDTPVSDFK